MGMKRCRNCRVMSVTRIAWCNDCIRAFLKGVAAAMGTMLGTWPGRTIFFTLLLATTAHAQSNTLSNVTVYSAVGLDAIHSFRAEDKSRAFTCQAYRLGATIGTAELLKRVVNKERPDHSDRKSFPSMHSGVAWASAGWKWQIGVPLAITTGGLRITAHKHDIWDVLAGSAIGFASHYIGPCEDQ